MRARLCTKKDMGALAVMNRQFLEDEQAESILSLEELKRQMAEFLEDGCQAFFLEDGGRTVGYALVRMDVTPLYLRQFFICRDVRRSGYGRIGFNALLEHLGVEELDLDIYAWNYRGLAFWRALGFEDRVYRMRFRKK